MTSELGKEGRENNREREMVKSGKTNGLEILVRLKDSGVWVPKGMNWKKRRCIRMIILEFTRN